MSRNPLIPRSPAAAAALLVASLAASACFYEPPAEAPEPFQPAAGTDVTGTDVLERDEMTLPASDMQELIEGRFPGVILQQGRGTIEVHIRGQNTVTGDNAALIVIDGIQSSGRALLAVNPAEVQRVEVLKNASAAIYGIRGANGVLVVTTRRH